MKTGTVAKSRSERHMRLLVLGVLLPLLILGLAVLWWSDTTLLS